MTIQQLIKLFLLLCWLNPLLSFAASSTFVEKPAVQDFIQNMVTHYHFDKNQLISLFKQIQPQAHVLETYAHPLEKETWKLYQRLFINENYIHAGAAFRKKYHQALVRAENKYGVPGSIIIATLGVETKYGTHLGNYRIIDALANLAFSQQPRAAYFRSELEQFLLLTRENNLPPLEVRGSYAGAIGAPQFMPSSYRHFGTSFSPKAQVDLIHNMEDAIASIANYYQKHGWKSPHVIAIPVTVQGKAYLQLISARPKVFSSSEIAKYGLIPQTKVPKGYPVKLLELEGQQGKEYWLVFSDFEVIKRYNTSNLYAMAVYQLSRRILQENSFA